MCRALARPVGGLLIVVRTFTTLPAAATATSLTVLALAAGLPVPAAQAQEVRITPSASISEEWTDNVGGVGRGGGGGGSDLITTLNAGAGITVDGARTDLNARYRLSYDQYISNDELSGMRHNLAGNGSYELVDDHLFIDGRTTISQRNVGLGALTASERTASSGQTGIWTYALGPTWRQRFSDFADASLGYRLSGSTFFAADVGDAGDSSRPSDSIGHEVNAGLASGDTFGRLSWNLTSLLGNYYNDGDLRQERRTVDLGTEYRISPEVGVILRGGYDDIQFYETEGISRRDANEEDVSAPFWTVGLRYNPSPNLNTRVEVGRRFEDPYYSGEIGWDITSRTNLTASYTMDVVTQQQALIESQCADPDDPLCLPLEEALTNDSFRRKTLSVRFTHRYERTTYGLSGSWVEREFNLDRGTDDSTLQFLASVNHNLTPSTSGVLQIGYTLGDTTTSRTAAATSDDVQSLRGNVGVTHQFTEKLTGSLSYSHLRREEGDDDTSSENSIIARLSATF